MSARHAVRAAAAALILALGASGADAAPAAKAKPASLSHIDTVSGKVTIKAIDYGRRTLTVAIESGDTVTLRAPKEVRNFENLKVGDVIAATYARETELVISQPGKPLPKDAQTLVGARSKPGELPGGLVANHVVVTGAVLAVDNTNHTLKIVSPGGGEVHTVKVRRPEGQVAMTKLKPGDKITAYVTEALLVSTNPTK